MISTKKWKLNKSEITIIAVLTVLTALEPLSIDTYLSSFIDISETLNTPIYNVQISLSVFLGGFAVGQLFWGPLSDRIGRRVPILLSLMLFSAASFLCMATRNIETFWIARFFQAFFGCAPVVISRAVITDSFPSGKILLAFSILSMTQSVAPLAGPAAGNLIRELFSWRYIFFATGMMGIFSALCAFFFLKETNEEKSGGGGFFANCAGMLANRGFLAGCIAGSAVYAALMVYISNSSVVFMREFGVGGNVFSAIFIANSVAIIAGSFFISGKSGQNKSERYLKISFACMIALSAALYAISAFGNSLWGTAAILFGEMFALGVLFPTTVNLALKPFSGSDKSGTASSLFGFFQLAFAFIFTIAANRLFEDPLLLMPVSLLACAVAGIAPYALKPGERKGAVE